MAVPTGCEGIYWRLKAFLKAFCTWSWYGLDRRNWRRRCMCSTCGLHRRRPRFPVKAGRASDLFGVNYDIHIPPTQNWETIVRAYQHHHHRHHHRHLPPSPNGEAVVRAGPLEAEQLAGRVETDRRKGRRSAASSRFQIFKHIRYKTIANTKSLKIIYWLYPCFYLFTFLRTTGFTKSNMFVLCLDLHSWDDILKLFLSQTF